MSAIIGSGQGGFTTQWCDVQELQAGDTYRAGEGQEREVLALVQRAPMGGALLEVRCWPGGNVVRSCIYGRVFIVRPRYCG